MSIKTLLYGLGLGAGTMYLFDPDRGTRRRALLRDQAIRSLNRTDDAIAKGTRDLSNRASGAIAEMKAALSGEQVSDAVLAERARSKIGRIVSHPRALDVSGQDGRIIVRGPILASEVTPLLTRLASVRGVRGVDNQLEVHEQPGDVPALQGEPAGTSFAATSAAWTPGIRLLAALAGVIFMFNGWRRGGILGLVRRTVGMALLTRSVTNRGLGQLIGIGAEPGAVTVRKGIQVNAPVDEVFRFWQNLDNFPRFMANVLAVEDQGQGRSHWRVTGPAGTPVEWDAIITNLAPDQVIAWESVPGSAVSQSGLVRFAPADAGTHLNVQMSYTPPAGVIGHAVASFFGVNPKQAMDDDLQRLKTLIERGSIPGMGGGTVTREQIESQGGQRKGDGSLYGGEGPGRAPATAGRQVSETGERESRGKPAGPSEDRPPATPRNVAPAVGRASFAGPEGEPPGAAGSARDRRESGMPGGGAGRIDEVGHAGVYPVSGPWPEDDAPVQGMASWGQGERGAAGYEDHGESELSGLGEETDLGSVLPGQPGQPDEPED